MYLSLNSRADKEEHNDGGEEHAGHERDTAKPGNGLVVDLTDVGLIVNLMLQTEPYDHRDGGKAAPHADQYCAEI